jgi:hypothetical protein
MTRIRFALVAVLLASCQYRGDPQVSAIAGTERINKEVTLEHIIPEPVGVTLAGEYEVLLANQSPNRYVFPVDLGVQLLVYSEKSGEWRKVENFITYLPPDGSIVLEPRGDWPENEELFSVLPVFEQGSEDSALRVIVVGHDEDGEAVAAYVDIPLNE